MVYQIKVRDAAPIPICTNAYAPQKPDNGIVVENKNAQIVDKSKARPTAIATAPKYSGASDNNIPSAIVQAKLMMTRSTSASVATGSHVSLMDQELTRPFAPRRNEADMSCRAARPKSEPIIQTKLVIPMF